MSEDITPSPIAVIDVGTNTLRLLIGYAEGGRIVRLFSERAVTRLGADLQRKRFLDVSAIENSISSLKVFKVLCDKYGVRKIFAIGTSALREARNSDEFLSRTYKSTGIAIRIISGDEEASLTLKGILVDGVVTEACPSLFIIDVGGGSTEWVWGNEFVIKDSVPVGAVKLLESFIEHDPPLPSELKRLKEYLIGQIQGSFSVHSFTPEELVSQEDYPQCFIATGGTATTLASVDLSLQGYDRNKIHLHRVTLPTLHHLFDKLCALSLAVRKEIQGLEPQRADIVVPGLLILITFMEMLRFKEVIISDTGLLEGALLVFSAQ